MSENTATISRINVEAFKISNLNGIDPIEAFWSNYGPGQGSVVITCYGSAWTAWFGAMNSRTIQEFFSSASTEYLVTKLGITQFLKQSKRNEQYLARIVDAVKGALMECSK